jgi:integrase/recombinase XerC
MQIQQYLEALGAQTHSAETLRAYKQDLERFNGFLSERDLQVDQVKPSNITDYLNYLATNKGRTAATTLAPATINRRLTVVSEYYEWLQRGSDDFVRNPIKGVKRPKVRNIEKRAVEDDVLETLVSGITSHRDRALVLLFLYTGVRLNELRMMDTTTLRVRREQMPDGSSASFGDGIVTGKGNKSSPIVAGPKALHAVALYLRDRAGDANPALFLSSRRQRLSCRSMQHIFDAAHR